MENLEIRKDGKLVETKWIYDDVKEEGEYKEFDVTSRAISKLFETCELAEDVTLKDVFLLLNSEVDIFDSIIGNWCKDIVTEGLKGPGKPYNLAIYDPDQIEYLELVFTPEYDDHDGEDYLYGLSQPDFHGVGVVLKNDDDVEHFKKGERIPWGVSLTSANDLINIPVKLNNKLEIYEGILKSKGPTSVKLAEFDNPAYTLGQILYGIIWELSFHGGPTSRDTFHKGLKSQVEQLKKDYEND